MAGGRFELAMEPTAIGLVSLNSNSETHMTVICDARLIHGRCGFMGIYLLCSFKMYFCDNAKASYLGNGRPVPGTSSYYPVSIFLSKVATMSMLNDEK